MTTEIELLQRDLTISKLNNEISKLQNDLLEIKYKLQKTQAEKVSKMEDSLYTPHLYEHYQKVAQFLATSENVPDSYKKKPNEIFIAMAAAYRIGLPVEQAMLDFAVIKNRACLWGDGLMALAWSHPEREWIKEEPILKEGIIVGYICTIKRKNTPERSVRFTLDDAKRAGLLGSNVWNKYPSRMLQMRARAFAIRDVFSDALRGIALAEVAQEDERILNAEYHEVPDKNLSNTEKLKRILEVENENVSESNPVDSDDVNDSSTSDQEHEAISEIDEDLPVTPEQIESINKLIELKNLPEDRKKSALDFYKVTSLDELSFGDANKFLNQLARI